MPSGLTAIERRILQLLCTTLTESGRPPSVQELKDAAGVPSVSSLHGYLDRLQRKGLIRRDPTRPRAIEVDCHEFEVARTSGAEPAPAATVAPPSPPEPTLEPEPETETVGGRPFADLEAEAGDEVDDTSESVQRREIYAETAVVEVPFLGEVAAGSPILATGDQAEAIYRLPIDLVGYGEALFMLRIRGDSMRDAGILDRDLVIVRRQTSVNDGEIAAALVDEEATVKRLSRQGGRVRLLSDNPAYGPIDARDAQILGKVVAIIRQIA